MPRWAIPSAISLSKSIGSDFDVLTSAAAFEKGWDNTTSSCKGSSAAFIMQPSSTLPGSSEISIAYSDSPVRLRCSRWWNPTYLEMADSACCKWEECNSLLNNSNSSQPMTSHKNRSVGVFKSANPRKTPAWIFKGYYNPKHPEGIDIKVKKMISTSGTEILKSEGQRWFPRLIRV